MEIQLPEYKFTTRTENGQNLIFDTIRKKYVSLTPEELVRQIIIRFLVEEKGFPSTLITIEGSININGLKRRFDILANDNSGKPLLIVECKGPKIKISQKTFDQIAIYNIKTMVEYLLITNGLTHYCCKLNFETKSYDFLKEIPSYFSITPKGSK